LGSIYVIGSTEPLLHIGSACEFLVSGPLRVRYDASPTERSLTAGRTAASRLRQDRYREEAWLQCGPLR